MKEKVLVLDIDGTLTNSRKEITEETKRAIRTVLEHGHKVTLASGGPTPGMQQWRKGVGAGKIRRIFIVL